MNIFSVTSNIVPENLYADKAVVTLGIDSGVAPTFERRPKWRIEQTLCYHFLVPKNTPEWVVVNYSFLPGFGSSYRYGDYEYVGFVATKYKIVFRKNIEGNSEYDYWRVDIAYELITPEPSQGDQLPEPSMEDEIINLSRSTRIVEVPAWRDYRNYPVTNSAGQLFNPPITREVLIDTWHITRREYWNPHVKIDNYKRCVNSSPIWNGKFNAWEVLVENIDAPETRVARSIARHWDVTYTLSINTEEDGWKTAVLDQGYSEKVEAGKDDKGGTIYKSVLIMNEKDPTPVSSPVMLDGKGKKLDTKKSDWKPFFAWANGSPFEFRYAKDLNALKIPNPYI